MIRSLSDLNLSWYLEKILKDIRVPDNISPKAIRINLDYDSCRVIYDFTEEEIKNLFELRKSMEAFK